ncbi:MAG: leucine--tRNA ligase [Gammaproteobacteria bacterium]
MDDQYHPEKIEAQAQEWWREHATFRALDDPTREKFYCLCMFPYPSGKLHMGHVRNYTIGDVISRFQRMRGRNVLQPMGWDAFGLPAENAAMQNGVPPARWTRDNIAYMRSQLQALGFALDWDRELATCDPDYYRWNQWLFLRMREKGIAYKKTGVVNWDPVDQTVLANEQVIDGRGWRTGALVERREIPMYYLNITRYADQLTDALDGLDEWPERVRVMQQNWIGRSEGVAIRFPYDGGAVGVFTTRADTLLGATWVAVAPEHPLAIRAAQADPTVAAFIEECGRGGNTEAEIATQEKRGVPTNLTVEHPLTGEALPVWVANYVLMAYGEGAVMAVPAHDQRDLEFARKYDLPIKIVVRARDVAPVELTALSEAFVTKDGVLCNSGKYDGLGFTDAVASIAADLAARGLGELKVQYRLRDWGISRQRYWGCPIPIIHCDSCGEVPVPDEQLPVRLPENLVPDGHGNPLSRCADFVNVDCPACGAAARRETDTMDTFVDSSWYFLRFASAGNDDAMVDARVDYWLPVDQYIGGIEHAILHLLYSRFWVRVMRDLGFLGFDEPFRRLLTQGMVLNHVYSRREGEGRVEYFNPADVHGTGNGATLRADGRPVTWEGMGTMSKSKNNGVDPNRMVDEYGADTARLFMLFTSPPELSLEWSDAGIDGATRFLRRLWRQVADHVAAGPAPAVNAQVLSDPQRVLRRHTHETIAKVTDDVGRRYTFNTAIAAVMELINHVSRFEDSSEQGQAVVREALESVVLMLAPMVPHICHAMWRALGHAGTVADAAWPAVDDAALVRDTLQLVIQVNGKLRGDVEVAKDADKATIERLALADPAVAKHLEGKQVARVIVVPGRLVNIVTGNR